MANQRTAVPCVTVGETTGRVFNPVADFTVILNDITTGSTWHLFQRARGQPQADWVQYTTTAFADSPGNASEFIEGASEAIDYQLRDTANTANSTTHAYYKERKVLVFE